MLLNLKYLSKVISSLLLFEMKIPRQLSQLLLLTPTSVFINVHNFFQEPEMKREVVPPLSDCVQLSVEQYRQKLYDIIKQEKIVR